MPSLKALRTRINSVKSTQKITSAMKMVAASKLRRAQAQAEAAQPYAERMERMLRALASSMADQPVGSVPPLLGGTGRDQKHLIVSVTADRGLAGGFNVNSARATRNLLRRLEGEGKSVKLIAIGRKGRDYLRREFADKIIENPMKGGKKRPEFGDAELVSAVIQEMLAKGEVDVVTLVYNRFVGVMSQVPTEAGFFAAQMTAMDAATRNAGDMIKRLTLNYNRARQANITSELVEIISGAEAV
jgi:F-type H+-transporting ATPase subunit gamma